MANYRTARIIPVALVLIIIALAIAALFSVARVIFFPNSISDTSEINLGHNSLISTTAGRSVKMFVRGPIVSEEEARSYQITVTPNERHFVTYQGYLGTVIKKIDLPNNIPAYKEFVSALDNAQMMNGNSLKGTQNDRSGLCATGYVYEFGIYNDDKLVKELWTTSCSNAHGSLSVRSLPLRKLFNAQIPEAQSITDRLWL